MIQLVYLAGAGRSGSTLVERTLGHALGAFCLGEFHALWRLPAAEITCSCGAHLADCPIWGEAAGPAEALARLRELEERCARHGRILAARGRLAEIYSADVREFLDLQWAVLERLRAATGATRFIDSSKAAPRAWLLASDPRIDLRLLRLDRHASEIIASWLSRKFDPGLGRPMEQRRIPSIAADILKTRVSLRLLSLARPMARLAYDDFASAPERALRRLAAAGCLPPEFAHDLEGGDTLPPMELHTLNGNPDRFIRGPIRISPRSAMSKLAPWQRTVAALAGACIDSVPV